MRKLLMRGGDLQVLQFSNDEMGKVKRLAKKYGIVKEDKKKIIFYFEQFENVKPAVKDAAQDATQQCLKSAT